MGPGPAAAGASAGAGPHGPVEAGYRSWGLHEGKSTDHASSVPLLSMGSPVSRSTGALTPDAAAAPAAVCWSTPAGWIEGGKIASG